MTRRQFVAYAGATALGLAVPLLSGCGSTPGPSPATRLTRIGFLGPPTSAPLLSRGLSELGYVEGSNLYVESRDDVTGEVPFLNEARELVGQNVDLIVVANI